MVEKTILKFPSNTGMIRPGIIEAKFTFTIKGKMGVSVVMQSNIKAAVRVP